MKINFLFTAYFLVILPVEVLAQTAAPIAFDTKLNITTGERYIEQIVLDRGGEIKAYQFEQLIRPTVEAYAQAPAQIPVAFGNPAPIGTPTGLKQNTGAELPVTPIGHKLRKSEKSQENLRIVRNSETIGS